MHAILHAPIVPHIQGEGATGYVCLASPNQIGITVHKFHHSVWTAKIACRLRVVGMRVQCVCVCVCVRVCVCACACACMHACMPMTWYISSSRWQDDTREEKSPS